MSTTALTTRRDFASAPSATITAPHLLHAPARRRAAVHTVDPLADARWSDLVARHSSASVFHSAAWLQALARTYGYKPSVLTTSEPGQPLQNGLPICEVSSWITGRRLVSLPFSDHCTPLFEDASQAQSLINALDAAVHNDGWKYYELRSLEPLPIASRLPGTTVTYSFHHIDLTPALETLFSNLHKNSIQRKIHRAEREKLQYEEGASDQLLGEFYRLFTLTRRRHGLPPQPRTWFRNLADGFGDALKVRVAFWHDRAVAAMITLRHKQTLVYKYGASDSRYHALGGVPFLFWRAIQDAKSSGVRTFDLGRTDAAQQSLITFKNRWGAAQSALTYLRYSEGRASNHLFDQPSHQISVIGKRICGCLNPKLLSTLGTLLYPHVG
jgi:CelD/BcsL family acetyltransferase involved in cellulose biosynthesis